MDGGRLDWRGGTGDKGREDGRTMMKERRKGGSPFEIENRKELIYWSWILWGGGGVVSGEMAGGGQGRMGIQD